MESKASISEIGINCIKRVFRAAVLLAAGIVAGYGLLTLVYLLPTKPMQANMASAADLFDKEREYYRVITGYISTQLDNYTDTWMVGNAVLRITICRFGNRLLRVQEQSMEKGL